MALDGGGEVQRECQVRSLGLAYPCSLLQADISCIAAGVSAIGGPLSHHTRTGHRTERAQVRLGSQRNALRAEAGRAVCVNEQGRGERPKSNLVRYG